MKQKYQFLMLLLAVSLILSACGPSAKQAATQTATASVDALTFLIAFHNGTADQYIGFLVKGEDREFSNYLMGMPPQGPLNLTLGTIGDNNQIKPLQSLQDWADAEAADKTMLMLQLTGGEFPRKSFNVDDMPVYSFTGRYMGESTSMIRLIFKTGESPTPFLIPVLIEGEVN